MRRRAQTVWLAAFACVVVTITACKGRSTPPNRNVDRPVIASAVQPVQGRATPVPIQPPAAKAATTPGKPATAPTLDELLLFFPVKYPSGNWKPARLHFDDVWFNAADGTKLHGWYCPVKTPRAVVLYAHGNGGNLSYCTPVLERFVTLGLTVFIFDYRGYGRSEGVPAVEGILQDARAARAELSQRAGVGEEQIVLMGRSLGGAVAVQLAAESKARGLILQNTFSSLKEIAAYHYPKLAFLVPTGKLDSMAAIVRHHGPLLECHGDADETIPFALGERLFRAANAPKYFVRIPGGDHNDPLPAEYYRQLSWFIDQLPTKKAGP